MRPSRSPPATAAAVVLTLVLIVALLLETRSMYPLNRGSVDDFWTAAVGVSPHGRGNGGLAACIEGDTAYYLPPSMDAVWTNWVPVSDVMRDYPIVIKELERRALDSNRSDNGTKAYRRWKALPLASQDGINGLASSVKDARTATLLADPDARVGASSSFTIVSELMHDQIKKAHEYWFNFLFEFLYLGGLLWFLFFPFIRRESVFRILCRLFTVPFWLLLPAWFGYCALCVNGPGPAGGIIYPYIIWVLDRAWPFPNNHWELAFLRALPKLLEPINQTSWKLDYALTSDFFARNPLYIAGPIEAMLIGLALCISFLAARLVVRLAREARLNRPGFEILP